jgi:uncharacterized membrane protein
MRLPIPRIIVLAIMVEAIAIAILAVLVAIFGPRGSGDSGAMQAFAEHLGQFVGPIASAILCFLGAWWLARRAKQREVLCGFLLGTACVAIDLGLLFPLGGKFGWLIAASNAGRLIAGSLGGYVGRRTRIAG